MPINVRVKFLYTDTATHGPYAINTFHFQAKAGASDAVVAADARAALLDYYKTIGTSSASIQQYLSANLSGVVEFSYRSTSAAVGDPYILLSPSTVALGATKALPNQVCCASTAKGTPGGGVSLASSQNRVFLGPLSVNAIASTLGLLDPTFIATVVAASVRLQTGAVGGSQVWVAYSKKLASSTAVVGGHVDNRPDVQRRRAGAITSRNSW